VSLEPGKARAGGRRPGEVGRSVIMSLSVLELPQARVPLPARRRAAGLGLRFGAAGIDFVVVATLSIVVGLCAHIVLLFLPESAMAVEPIVLTILVTAITATYLVYSWGYESATLGQTMLGLCVRQLGDIGSGAPIGTPRALGRLVGFVVGALSLTGPLVALVRSDGRALHDVIADTIVVPDPKSAVAADGGRNIRQIRKERKYA
jgi:uncharacterized RDD family membrane protein YckC